MTLFTHNRYGKDEDAVLELVKAVSLSEVHSTQAQVLEASKKPISTYKGGGREPMDWPSLDTLMGPGAELSTPAAVEPPSYSSQVAVQPSKRRPPPGFGVSHMTVSRAKSEPVPLRGLPEKLEEEKQSAFQRLESILCNDPNKLKKLKVYSNYFIRNELSAPRYYDQCKALCGEHWLEVFDVLITGLPDDGKRSDLREIHRTDLQPPTWVSKKKSSKHASAKSSLRKKGGQRETSRTAWGPPSSGKGGRMSGAPLVLSEEDYPSLSTPASASTCTSSTPWSSRVVVRSK